MQKFFYATIVAICLFSPAFSQVFEIGVFGGASTYTGDLTHSMLEWSEVHSAQGILLGMHIKNNFQVNIEARHTTLSGNDSHSDKPAYLARNLSFETQVVEIAGTVNLYFINTTEGRKFLPYLSTGISYFHINPKAVLNGTTYELQPLGTEGQGTSTHPERSYYSLNNWAIPFGGGVKYVMNRKWSITLEAGFRKTFTDYIDDVSTTYVDPQILINESGNLSYLFSNRTGQYLQTEPLPYDESHPRGNPNNKDWFGYSGLTIAHTLCFNRAEMAAKKANIACQKF